MRPSCVGEDVRMRDLITLDSSAFEGSTRVVGFRGREAISRPYELEIFLVTQSEAGEEVDMADAVGAKARLVIDRQDPAVPPFSFSGIFARVDLLHQHEGRALFRAVLVPKLWLLGLSKHSRVFTKMTIPEILRAILDDNALREGSDYEIRLDGFRYAKEEHVCQYRESDLAFLSRWMEREGIYYYFQHGEGGEKLVLCDDKTYEQEAVGRPVRYHPQLGEDRSANMSFRSFQCAHAALPTLVKLSDYDYARPNLDVSGTADVSMSGVGEVVLHGERFFSPDDGKRLAKLRAEEMLARQVVFQARGTRFHLYSGFTFELDDHPRATFNARYLTIEATHYGNQAAGLEFFRELVNLPYEDTYIVELQAIPAKTQFRPAASTPWPRIYGFENGIIDGEADSEYAQIDGQGRYAVKFKFDESALKDGRASTYVRMMQPHGGGIEGFHFPLRKNTEVVFAFLGGDPDRPVISGVVPNALTPSPVTSANRTRNVLQTGGRNRMELEDLAGQQRITLSTPYSNTYLRMGSPNEGHELIVKTDDNTLLDAGKDFDLEVGNNGGGSWHTTVADHAITTICGGRVTGVGVSVGDAPVGGTDYLVANIDIRQQALTGKYELKTGTIYDVKIGTNWTTEVLKGSMTTTTKGDYLVTVTANNTTFDTKGTTLIKSEGAVTVQSTNATLMLQGHGLTTLKSDTADVVVDSPTNIQLNAKAKVLINGTEVQTKSTAYFKGITPSSLEFYGSKSAVGIHKADYAGLYHSGYGLKIETTGFAAGLFGMKGDSGNVKNNTFFSVLQTVGTHLANGVIAMGQHAAAMHGFGFGKFG
ncbi:type VI secretion system Vgr family protein [Sorangium sp. So ce341]|uniref:type VI secretion system Vgr family protein n=1 Tax=Sorangium sp. So ce341 TaxID=3133302 RepID=UPI003F600FF4